MTASIGSREEPPAETSLREPGHKLKQLLRADIVAGRIPAGSRLKVSDVIARYGTSTNPAREALHRQRPKDRGHHAQPRRAGSIDRRDFVNCMFDIRRLIEPYIARWFTDM